MSHEPFDFSEFTRGQRPSAAAGPSAAPPPVDPLGSGFAEFGAAAMATEPTATGPITVGPPYRLLAAAAVASALGGGLAALLGEGRPALALASWLFAGPVAFGLLGAFVISDSRSRARAVYASPTWHRSAYLAAVALAVLGVVVAAVPVADWVGRWNA